MSKKGFISAYFLVVLLVCLSVVMVILAINENHLTTVHNLAIANQYLNQEMSVINHLRCLYKSGSLSSGSYETNEVSYQIEVYEDEAEIQIFYPLYELMSVQLEEDGHMIVDYKSENEELLK